MLSYIFGVKGASGFGSASTSTEVASELKDAIPGKNIVLTGCNVGIGKQNLKDFVRHNANAVVMLCRTPAKMDAVENEFKSEFPESTCTIHKIQCDLSDFDSIRQAAKEVSSLGLGYVDVLINNAGVMACPYQSTSQGYEMQVGTNFLGHFLLTNLLLPLLKKAKSPRVINVSSSAHDMAGKKGILFDQWKFSDENKAKYSEWTIYGQSKLLNIVHSKVLQEKADAKGVKLTSVALHPGAIPGTDLARHLNPLVKGMVFTFARGFMKSVDQGSATTMYCALSSEVEEKRSDYYVDCNVAKWNEALVKDASEEVWRQAVEITGSDVE